MVKRKEAEMGIRNFQLFPVLASTTLPFLFSFAYAQSGDDIKALQLQPRESFNINLPKISVSADDETQEFNGVKIIFPESNDILIIGTGDDYLVKNTSHGAEKTLYREPYEKSGYVTKFEARNLNKVDQEFANVLDEFDKLLQKGKWGRLLYLDAYFPHFLNGYFYLICAIRNSTCALPRAAHIPEEGFDVSLYSAKTDARINQWRGSQDQIIKLRISGKELAHQLRIWEKALSKISDNEDVAVSKELEEAFVVFVRVYFNLKPPSPVVFKKRQ
jgi:hypothetical protein